MSLEIERAWHREPGWLSEQSTETQERLLAWWQVHCRPPSAPPAPAQGPGRPKQGRRGR